LDPFPSDPFKLYITPFSSSYVQCTPDPRMNVSGTLSPPSLNFWPSTFSQFQGRMSINITLPSRRTRLLLQRTSFSCSVLSYPVYVFQNEFCQTLSRRLCIGGSYAVYTPGSSLSVWLFPWSIATFFPACGDTPSMACCRSEQKTVILLCGVSITGGDRRLD
jgi:hypothetical protein